MSKSLFQTISTTDQLDQLVPALQTFIDTPAKSRLSRLTKLLKTIPLERSGAIALACGALIEKELEIDKINIDVFLARFIEAAGENQAIAQQIGLALIPILLRSADYRRIAGENADFMA